MKTGIELGIRAPMDAVMRGAEIARFANLDYFFVPETHPKKYGVDAFEALNAIATKNQTIKIATGIVSVFSRDVQELYRFSTEIYEKSNSNFVLGLGTSTREFAEMHGQEFSRPVARMVNYTKYIKSKFNLPIYWATVGNRMVELSGKYSDGSISFMKSERKVKESVMKVRESLYDSGRKYDDFQTISIRPTYITRSESEWRKHASMTIANYVIGNPFYSEGLKEFWKEVSEIKKESAKGIVAAAEKVSKEMAEELTTHGNFDQCASDLYRHMKGAGVKTVIAGFDSSRSGYNSEFFNNLERFATSLGSLV